MIDIYFYIAASVFPFLFIYVISSCLLIVKITRHYDDVIKVKNERIQTLEMYVDSYRCQLKKHNIFSNIG